MTKFDPVGHWFFLHFLHLSCMVTLFTSNHCVVHLWLHICHLCSPVSAFSAGNVSENVLSLLIVLPLLKMAQMS